MTRPIPLTLLAVGRKAPTLLKSALVSVAVLHLPRELVHATRPASKLILESVVEAYDRLQALERTLLQTLGILHQAHRDTLAGLAILTSTRTLPSAATVMAI
jgi:hypothetical protein